MIYNTIQDLIENEWGFTKEISLSDAATLREFKQDLHDSYFEFEDLTDQEIVDLFNQTKYEISVSESHEYSESRKDEADLINLRSV